MYYWIGLNRTVKIEKYSELWSKLAINGIQRERFPLFLQGRINKYQMWIYAATLCLSGTYEGKQRPTIHSHQQTVSSANLQSLKSVTRYLKIRRVIQLVYEIIWHRTGNIKMKISLCVLKTCTSNRFTMYHDLQYILNLLTSKYWTD